MLFNNTPHVTCKNEDTCVIESIEIGDVNIESFQIKHKQDLGVNLFCESKSNIGYGQVGRLQPHFYTISSVSFDGNSSSILQS